MTTIINAIRILLTILLIEKTYSQDGSNNGGLFGYQQMSSNNGQTETVTGYSTNNIQNDPGSQTASSANVQYLITDDSNKNTDYNQANRGRNKKTYRIKNPFQTESEEKSDGNTNFHDTGTASVNQNLRYSLPSESFLQQMKAENQYYQQQSQLTTSAPNFGYTATPQPQHQLSTISTSNYDANNQQLNQFTLESKVPQTQTYFSNSNYQFNPKNAFGFGSIQSTPSPVNLYFSTSQPDQYLTTSGNTYSSSSSPIFLSSPSNMQSYVSSPLSPIQTVSPDYNNRISTTIGSTSLNFENMDSNRNIQIDHYDNSANGVRYPTNLQAQYQIMYPSSTPSPSSTTNSGSMRESWHNTLNAGINALSKPLQEMSLHQLQSYHYKNHQQDQTQQEIKTNNNNIIGSQTHRMESQPSANNIYMNYVQPDYQTLNNFKSQTRDLNQNINQQDKYTNGDYGWKLGNKNTISSQDVLTSGPTYPNYSTHPTQSEGGAVSQMSFHMDTGKSYNSESQRKISDNSQEFIKNAAKTHENIKNQHQLFNSNYPSNYIANNQISQNPGINVINVENEKKKNKYTESTNPAAYSVSSSPPELITASPYYYSNNRGITLDSKIGSSFDHAKALQNIVPIDVSNVVSNTNSQSKRITGLENIRYNIGKEQTDQHMNQFYRTYTDPIYKDKNTLYSFNLKTKPEDFFGLDKLRQAELGTPYNGVTQQSQETAFNPNSYTGASQSLAYTPHSSNIYQNNMQLATNYQHQDLQRPQNQLATDIASILKLNDGSHRLESTNFNQGSVTSSLPVKFNQNLDSHQLDVNANVLSKLITNKYPAGNVNRPELDAISTINGYKVANPYNVDLRLIAELLQGKPTSEESHILTFKDQLNRPAPIKLDLTQLQPLLRNENSGNLAPISDSISAYSNPYIDVYGSGQYPYQGVKYSRSQEEEESLVPIADSSNVHPIGAVMEQVDTENEHEITAVSDIVSQAEDDIFMNFERTKKSQSSSNKGIGDKQRNPNWLAGRNTYSKKYPVEEPYRLLKPPPPHSPRHRNVKTEKYNRRRRMNRPKDYKIIKIITSEPTYGDESDEESGESTIPILLKPPPLNAEKRIDT